MKKFGVLLAAFLVLSLVVLPAVLAADPIGPPAPATTSASGTIEKVFFDPIKDMFAEWEKGQLSTNIAKYCFWILLTFLIYAILGFIPIFKRPGDDKPNEFLIGIIALVCGFLATAYLTPDDIYIMMSSWTSMGLVFAVILPAVILLFFGIEISKTGGVGARFLSRIMMTLYAGFVIGRAFYGMFTISSGTGQPLLSKLYGFIYIGFAIAAVIWAWYAERKFMKFMFREEAKDESEGVERHARETAIAAQALALEREGAAGRAGARHAAASQHSEAEDARREIFGRRRGT